MASISNSRWQNPKERPNLFKNNKDMTNRAICYVVCRWVTPLLERSWAYKNIKYLFISNFLFISIIPYENNLINPQTNINISIKFYYIYNQVLFNLFNWIFFKFCGKLQMFQVSAGNWQRRAVDCEGCKLKCFFLYNSRKVLVYYNVLPWKIYHQNLNFFLDKENFIFKKKYF